MDLPHQIPFRCGALHGRVVLSARPPIQLCLAVPDGGEQGHRVAAPLQLPPWCYLIRHRSPVPGVNFVGGAYLIVNVQAIA